MIVFKLNLLLFLIFLTNLVSYAQTLTGRVLEADTKKPISYVNIGILGKNTGTVSDSLGNFSITYKDANKNDTLKFSCIGFESRILKPTDLIGKSHNEISMEKIIYTLKEVVVKPLSKREIKVLGKTGYSKFMGLGSKCTRPGASIGVLLKNKGPLRIQKVNLICSSDCKDEVLFRINLSDGETDRPDNSLLKKPIIFKYRFKKGNNFFDLTEYNIEASKDFYLSYELISLPKGSYGPQFGVSFLGPKCYWRTTSQATWDQLPKNFCISFSATVRKLR